MSDLYLWVCLHCIRRSCWLHDGRLPQWVFIELKNSSRAFSLLLKGYLTIFHPTSTVRIARSITILFNTHRRIHNNSFHLNSCQSSLYPHILHIHSLSHHVHPLLGGAFHAQALSESNVMHPTSATVSRPSRNVEESQRYNSQLFLYRVLWVRISWLEADRIVGDPDINLHPSHSLGGILKVSLFHTGLPVCLTTHIFMSTSLWSLKKTSPYQQHPPVFYHL